MDMNETLKILATLARIPIYTASDILELMDGMGVDERGFALLMNVSTTTVHQWTNGKVIPSGAARRLMQVYDLCPTAIDVMNDMMNDDDFFLRDCEE